MTDKLDGDARKSGLKALREAGWTHDPKRDAIHKTYKFRDFVDAFGFMTKSALIAEKMNHHPEWSNIYNTVEVTLITHDVDGLSELDVSMAVRMDKLIRN